MNEKEIYRAIEEGGVFNLMGNSPHLLKKDEIVTIAKEVDYLLYEKLGVKEYKKASMRLIELLKESWE